MLSKGLASSIILISVRCDKLLPPANVVWGKVIILHLFVILFTGGGVCLSACWDTPAKETPPG